MTVIVRNIDDHTRTWPDLTRLDGRVLVLDPGEEGELADHPGEVAHLQVRKPKPSRPDTQSTGG